MVSPYLVKVSSLASSFRTTPMLGILAFGFSAGFPPFDDLTEVNLTAHMTQHVLIVLAGVLVAYPLAGRRMLATSMKSFLPGASLAAAAVMIAFWHLPGPWDAAVLNPAIHVVEHLSFFAVGLLAGSWLLVLSDSVKIGALLAAFFGHMGYAVILISPWNVEVYSLYSLSDQVVMGWVLLLTGPTLVVGIAYVIARNPDWLGGFSAGTPTRGKRETILNRAKVPRYLAPLLSLIIVAVLLGYFVTTAYALSNSRGVAAGESVVFIEETPVSWQYTPQVVTVVLGANATVTWVSHSISYDTVTDREGSFSSGPIAPGQSYTHTFLSPGEYNYFCQYHPWMTAKIIVIASGK
jgi:plastocyanin